MLMCTYAPNSVVIRYAYAGMVRAIDRYMSNKIETVTEVLESLDRLTGGLGAKVRTCVCEGCNNPKPKGRCYCSPECKEIDFARDGR
jgi:hypothetical protein